MSEVSAVVVVKLDKDRMISSLKVREFIEIQEGNIKTIVDVLSRFSFDENGNQLSPQEAKDLLKELTLQELMSIAQEFGASAEKTAVPPGNGAD